MFYFLGLNPWCFFSCSDSVFWWLSMVLVFTYSENWLCFFVWNKIGKKKEIFSVVFLFVALFSINFQYKPKPTSLPISTIPNQTKPWYLNSCTKYCFYIKINIKISPFDSLFIFILTGLVDLVWTWGAKQG